MQRAMTKEIAIADTFMFILPFLREISCFGPPRLINIPEMQNSLKNYGRDRSWEAEIMNISRRRWKSSIFLGGSGTMQRSSQPHVSAHEWQAVGVKSWALTWSKWNPWQGSHIQSKGMRLGRTPTLHPRRAMLGTRSTPLSSVSDPALHVFLWTRAVGRVQYDQDAEAVVSDKSCIHLCCCCHHP